MGERLHGLIAEGLARFHIDAEAGAGVRLATYLRELERWNRTMNLVGQKEGVRILSELVYDAFFLHSRLPGAASVLDMGSGSGVVSVTFAVLDPARKVFSVEKSLKKVQFQGHVKRLLGLQGLTILRGRVEEIPPVGVDAVVAKAFGPIGDVLRKGGRHLNEGGSVFIVKGKGEKAQAHGGFAVETAEPYVLPGSDKSYQLFVYKKVS